MTIPELVAKYKGNTQGMTFKEQLECVIEYIKEKKHFGVKIDIISIRTQMDIILFHVAFCTAFDYFVEKYETIPS